MKLSQEGFDHIKQWEGTNVINGMHHAYQDQAGVWTIGYGHTVSAGRPVVEHNLVITHDEAEAILRRDVSGFERAVLQAVKKPMSQSQYDAFVSFCFNIGAPAFRSSTALRRFNAGDVEGAAEAMAWFNKVTIGGKKVVSKGLVNRRASEVDLFLSDRDDAPLHEGITGGEHKPLRKSSTMQAGGLGVVGLVLGKIGDLGWLGQLSNTAQLAVIGLVCVIVAVMGRRIWDHYMGVE